MRVIGLITAALALAAPITAQAFVPTGPLSWTIFSGGSTLSGNGNTAQTIDGGSFVFTSVNAPSPTIFVSGQGNSPNGYHFEVDLDYTLTVHGPAPSFVPIYFSCSPTGAPCPSPNGNGSLKSVFNAEGTYAMGGASVALQTYVNQFRVGGCDTDTFGRGYGDCGILSYVAALDASEYAFNLTGTAGAFVVPVHMKLLGDLDGGMSSFRAALDPTVTLNPDFLAQLGYSASDVTIDFDGVGNTTNSAGVAAFAGGAGAVPEPTSWLMMLGGFAVIGTGLRRRRITDALA